MPFHAHNACHWRYHLHTPTTPGHAHHFAWPPPQHLATPPHRLVPPPPSPPPQYVPNEQEVDLGARRDLLEEVDELRAGQSAALAVRVQSQLLKQRVTTRTRHYSSSLKRQPHRSVITLDCLSAPTWPIVTWYVKTFRNVNYVCWIRLEFTYFTGLIG